MKNLVRANVSAPFLPVSIDPEQPQTSSQKKLQSLKKDILATAYLDYYVKPFSFEKENEEDPYRQLWHPNDEQNFQFEVCILSLLLFF